MARARTHARKHTRAHTHVSAAPTAAHLNFSECPTVWGGGLCGGHGALDQVGLGSLTLRAPLHTWFLPSPLPAPGFSLASFPHLQNRLPTPISQSLRAAGVCRRPYCKAHGGRGRCGARGRAAVQRHHSGSSTYCGAGVARSAPPSDGSPSSCASSAFPSSSQTSTILSALGAGKLRTTRRTNGERGAWPLPGLELGRRGSRRLADVPTRSPGWVPHAIPVSLSLLLLPGWGLVTPGAEEWVGGDSGKSAEAGVPGPGVGGAGQSYSPGRGTRHRPGGGKGEGGRVSVSV